MFKVNNKDQAGHTTTGVFIVNFGNISLLVPVFLLFTLNW